jgi:hypothetical protein
MTGVAEDGLIMLNTDSHLATAPSSFDIGTSSVFTDARMGTSYSCQIQPGNVMESTTISQTLANPTIGIRAHGMSATIDWVAVVVTP